MNAQHELALSALGKAYKNSSEDRKEKALKKIIREKAKKIINDTQANVPCK